MILTIRGHPFVVLVVLILLAKWMAKNAYEPPLAIHAFLSQILFMLTSQNLNKSFSDPPGEEHSEPPIRQGLLSKTF
jgi:hypothetical protein